MSPYLLEVQASALFPEGSRLTAEIPTSSRILLVRIISSPGGRHRWRRHSESSRLFFRSPAPECVTSSYGRLMTSEHLSDSAVQRNAEGAIVQALAKRLGFEGALKAKRVAVLGGGYVQLDACSEDDRILVEAYVRQGKLKGAQIKKISQDILKLALLKRDPQLRDSRAIAVFASVEARDSITG